MTTSATRTRPFDVILGVPSDCSGSFVGCQFMPSALRAAGLVDAVGADDAGNLQVVMADPRRDPDTGVVGLDDLINLSSVVRDGTHAVLATGKTPLLIGGDCTLLIGVAAALASTHPDAGLLFIDGHMDCFDGHTSPTGEGSDMELAVLLGHGPQPLLDFGARTPAFPDDRVIVLGPFDRADAAALESPDPRGFAPRTRIVEVDELALHPTQHTHSALADLATSSTGFWLHLDLDVLSSEELPAVDYPDPRGLTFDQLRDVLTPIFASPHLIGASITILNPTLDTPEGDSAHKVVALLAEALPR